MTTGSHLPPDSRLDPTRDRSSEWGRHLALDADLHLAVDTAAGASALRAYLDEFVDGKVTMVFGAISMPGWPGKETRVWLPNEG